MPKFLTYQRPAHVSKQGWNHAPDRKVAVPNRAPEQQKPTAHGIVVPALDQLIRKE